MRRVGLLIVLPLLAGLAHAQPVHVSGGDTIILAGTIYRLWGIDAPELHQWCRNGLPAGTLAAEHLSQLTQGRTIACERKDTGRYGRTVALCRADGTDIGAAMVCDGWALAFVRYSSDYVEQERGAKAAGAGIHTHGCAPPREWRTNKRAMTIQPR